MSRLISRIIKYGKMIIKSFYNDCKFSFRLAVVKLLASTIGRMSKKIYRKCIDKKDSIIMKYLYNRMKPVIDKYENVSGEGVFEDNSPIWVCWWTGIQDAPKLVKQCIKSIQNNSGNHPVHIITETNYGDFLEIPDYIISKVKSGKMCIANFTDYLRVALLEQYGGLWLDATIFVPRTIPQEMFNVSLFTCKSPEAKGYYSNGRWTSYCIGGWKHHIFFRIVKACFEAYWMQEDVSIDYLLVDYTFSTAYDNNETVKRCIDSIPINNMQRNDLSSSMIKALPKDRFWDAITDETVVYKLSWREKYREKSDDGQTSVYGYFLNMKL